MTEFNHANLSDRRLSRRLGRVAEALAAQPGASIPQAHGNWGQTCAAYRFFDNDAVSFTQILQPHTARTLERARSAAVVLAVNDTTGLNFDHRPATTGLGPIRTRRDKTYGLWLHSLVCFTPAGTPLGLLQAQCWARDPAKFGSRHQRHRKTTAQKESGKWLQSYEALRAAAQQAPQTQWVFVADREADLYDLLVAASVPGSPGVLVRARHDRRLPKETARLFAHVAQAPVAGQMQVTVPRRPGQRARTATLTVRFCEVALSAPEPVGGRPSLRLVAIEARELHPPAGSGAIHWRLLTNLVVSDWAGAVEKLRWYAVRWGIEVFHRVLKSGCGVEAVQLQSAARLQRYLAVQLVVAWRVMALTHLGREHPETQISEILEESEWKLLWAMELERSDPLEGPTAIPNVVEGVRRLGRLGGHLGRRGDGPPGALCLARGLERLHDIMLGWQLAQQKTCA